MAQVLFLSQRIPYPPNKGDKIRSFNVLKHLAQDHDIHLGCFIDDPNDHQYTRDLKAYCSSIQALPLNKRMATLRSVKGLVSCAPLSLPYYENNELDIWVDEILEEKKPDIIYIFSSTMAQFVMGKDTGSATIVMDFVDVDSDKWRQYAQNCKFPMKWVYERESARLQDYEAEVADWANASLLVSGKEAELFVALTHSNPKKIHSIENGIDFEFFAKDAEFSPEEMPGTPKFCFTGAMDYWPNIDAVKWFCAEVFPKILTQHADAHFYIVGSSPDPVVLGLGAHPNITVTGRVPDVRPYIAAADVSVFPIRIARGIQNKVLEAMSMSKAVVTTSQGLEGIKATTGEHLLTADTPDEFAENILQLLDDQKRRHSLADAARRLIEDQYSWPSQLHKLDELLLS